MHECFICKKPTTDDRACCVDCDNAECPVCNGLPSWFTSLPKCGYCNGKGIVSERQYDDYMARNHHKWQPVDEGNCSQVVCTVCGKVSDMQNSTNWEEVEFEWCSINKEGSVDNVVKL